MATNQGGVRNGRPVVDPIQQVKEDSFFHAGPSDPRAYAGKNGVDKGPVPISHWTGGSDFYAVSTTIGRSVAQKGLRPERQTKAEQRQITPVYDSVIDGKRTK